MIEEKISYGGWPNCIRLSNGSIELIATTDVGPRVIRCSFVGGENLFRESPQQMGNTGGDEWRSYGGHRFWRAPEHPEATYAPDNGPIAHAWESNTLKLRQPVDASGVQKEIAITLQRDSNRIRVLHRLTNRTKDAFEIAPWAITVLAAGGRAIIPQEPFAAHSMTALLPVRALALWSYTDMSDPRFTWGTKYIQVRQDPSRSNPQKIGVTNTHGWMAYTLGGDVFVNRFPYEASANYPDFRSNGEVYTNDVMLEMETLGSLTMLAPGQSMEHTEEWSLHRAAVGADEEGIEKAMKPILAAAGIAT